MHLEAHALVVSIGRVPIVRGVDLTIAAGEVVGVLGPSGAGKTTLFRALVGELRPSAGAVTLDGVDVSSEPLWRRARRGLGYLPQTPSVLWDLSVQDNLRAFAQLAKQSHAGNTSHWAAAVELQGRLDVKARELSGGERRRLELARALVAQPRVLICDEPFAGIDPAGAERLADLLRQQADAGAAVVLADHHVEESLRVCTRAVLLIDGKLEAAGSPEVFREHPLVMRRYLGSWSHAHPGRSSGK